MRNSSKTKTVTAFTSSNDMLRPPPVVPASLLPKIHVDEDTLGNVDPPAVVNTMMNTCSQSHCARNTASAACEENLPLAQCSERANAEENICASASRGDRGGEKWKVKRSLGNVVCRKTLQVNSRSNEFTGMKPARQPPGVQSLLRPTRRATSVVPETMSLVIHGNDDTSEEYIMNNSVLDNGQKGTKKAVAWLLDS